MNLYYQANLPPAIDNLQRCVSWARGSDYGASWWTNVYEYESWGGRDANPSLLFPFRLALLSSHCKSNPYDCLHIMKPTFADFAVTTGRIN